MDSAEVISTTQSTIPPWLGNTLLAGIFVGAVDLLADQLNLPGPWTHLLNENDTRFIPPNAEEYGPDSMDIKSVNLSGGPVDMGSILEKLKKEDLLQQLSGGNYDVVVLSDESLEFLQNIDARGQEVDYSIPGEFDRFREQIYAEDPVAAAIYDLGVLEYRSVPGKTLVVVNPDASSTGIFTYTQGSTQ